MGIILVAVIILQEPAYSLTKKFWIIVVIASVVLWLDRPAWLVSLISTIKTGVQ